MKKLVKLSFLILTCMIMVLVSSCSQDSTKDYVEYNLQDDEIYELFKEFFPFTFSVKYPPEWTTGWSMDFGVPYFFIESSDLSVETSQGGRFVGIYMIISESEIFDGKSAKELLIEDVGEKDFILAPYATTINGFDASQATYLWDEDIIIEAYIIKGSYSLFLSATIPQNMDSEFRPIVESILKTIKLGNLEK